MATPVHLPTFEPIADQGNRFLITTPWLAVFQFLLEQAAGTGDVIGPGTSLDGQIVLFDGLTGDVLKGATGSGFVTATNGVYGVTSFTEVDDLLSSVMLMGG